MTRSFVTLRTGSTARFLREPPNGTSTQTFASFNSLASIIGGCATGRSSSAAFLAAATDAWGHRPHSTWEAMSLLPQKPSGDPGGVFDQIPVRPGYRPVLHDAPAAWVLALQFVGNGRQFNGPGNVAFDEDGAVWTINNAQWAVKLTKVCPGLGLFKLDPFSAERPLDQYTGGGINGAGFGVGFDPHGRIWVGNFGFTGTRCPTVPTSNSVLEFRQDGQPISPPEGHLEGPRSWPQGTKSDRDGNIWIANCGNSTLVEYPNGDPLASRVIGTGIGRAFDVAVNTEGNVFVTADEGNQVYGFDADGDPLPGSPYGDDPVFSLPLRIASDRLGRTWVSLRRAAAQHRRAGRPVGERWLTNNWEEVPAQVNPFGRGLVAYIGMAPPVRAPLIGAPQLP